MRSKTLSVILTVIGITGIIICWWMDFDSKLPMIIVCCPFIIGIGSFIAPKKQPRDTEWQDSDRGTVYVRDSDTGDTLAVRPKVRAEDSPMNLL